MTQERTFQQEPGFYPENPVEIKKREEKPLLEELIELLEEAPDGLFENDKERKIGILRSLPEDIITYFENHIQESKKKTKEVEASKMVRERSGVPILDERAVVFGELFELLVRSDEKLLGKQSPEAREILRILNNPDLLRAGSDFERVPDGVGVDISPEGQIVINSVFECKTGLLDERAIDQFIKFPNIMIQLAHEINKVGDYDRLEELGFDALALRRLQMETQGLGDDEPLIERPKKVARVLVVPAERTDDKEKLLKPDLDLKGDELNEFKRIGKKALQSVHIARSPFSTTEISMLTNFIMKKVEANRYKKYKVPGDKAQEIIQ